MESHISKEVLKGLNKARSGALDRKKRLRVHMGEEVYPVLRAWDGGFALTLDQAPQLRGFVDLYDGTIHLHQCLIVCSEAMGDEMHYEFKRQTIHHDRAPVDFVRETDGPAGLLPSV